MAKLLKVLTVFSVILAAVALTLGIMLFKKRELLKGRTHKLETAFIKLGTFIEDEPSEPATADFTEKDTAECSPQDEAEYGSFWAGYKPELESSDQKTINLARRKADLQHYYKIDHITAKVARDERNLPVTKGKGTMQYVLDDTVSKAEDQLNRLNATREQLVLTRQELNDTIDDLNTRKGGLRERRREIVQLNANIADLEANIRRLNGTVDDLEAKKRDLEDNVALLETDVAEKAEKITEQEEAIAVYREQIEVLTGRPGGTMLGPNVIKRDIQAGYKGKVVSINPEWNFAVLELSDDFLAEIDVLKDRLAKSGVVGSVPTIELLLKRNTTAAEFVTKVRIIQIKKAQKLGIADILIDWQHLPIHEGDVAFY